MSDSISPDAPLRQCVGLCQRLLPATTAFFYAARKRRDGLDSKCKQCRDAFKKPPVPEGKKRCAACKEPFPATTDYFHPDKSRIDGLFPWCRVCYKARHKASPWDKSKYNPIQHRNSYRANIEKRSEHSRQYYQDHKAEYNARDRNRYARKRAVAGKHTPQQLEEQYARQKGKCYYCHKKVKWGKHHVEHTFPISRVTGTDIPANDISYLVIACAHCNESKHDKFPWEWPQGNRLL